jgi:hypothetical protein
MEVLEFLPLWRRRTGMYIGLGTLLVIVILVLILA